MSENTVSTHTDKLKTRIQIGHVFKPKTSIEMVFNMDDDTPIVLPTVIHQCKYDSEAMLLYQTLPEIKPGFRYRTLDIAALITEELNRKARFGLKCKILKYVNDFKISATSKKNVLLIRYFPPMRSINLRSTYRLKTSEQFSVEGKILLRKDIICKSGVDFSVTDISVTGIGLLVPKKRDGINNPLLDATVGETYDLALLLNETEGKGRGNRITTQMEIARTSASVDDENGFVGARFMDLKKGEAEKLYKFIHHGQVAEIRDQKGI